MLISFGNKSTPGLPQVPYMHMYVTVTFYFEKPNGPRIGSLLFACGWPLGPMRAGCLPFLGLLLGSSGEQTVDFQLVSQTSTPSARAFSQSIIQHTVTASSAAGRYVWRFGGRSAASAATDDVWRFEMQTGTWTQASPSGSAPSARRGASIVLDQEAYAYVFGGETGSARLNDMYMLIMSNVASPSWASVTYDASGAAAPAVRSGHSATASPLLQTNTVPTGMIIFGGTAADGTALGDTHSFRFDTSTWAAVSPTGTPPAARSGHAACLVLSSIVAIHGGANTGSSTVYVDVVPEAGGRGARAERSGREC